VSTTRTVIELPQPRQGQPGRDPEAAFGPRPGRELAVQQLGPLAHAGDAVPGAVDGAAVPVVDDLDGHLVVLLVDDDPAVPGAGVADHVGDRLLDDAEGGLVDVGGQKVLLPSPSHIDAGRRRVRVKEPIRAVPRDRHQFEPVAFEFAFGWGWLVNLLEDHTSVPHGASAAVQGHRLGAAEDKVDAAILAQLLRRCCGTGQPGPPGHPGAEPDPRGGC
jgi:hypothetical protein